MDSNAFFIRFRKYLIIAGCAIVFFATLIINIPAWVLNSPLTKYSHNQLRLYNLSGSFWNGSGLLVASSASKQNKIGAVPLIHISWKISLGLSKYVDVSLFLDQHKIADVYLDKSGLNIDNLSLSLSVSQVSRLSNVVDDLKVSGSLQIKAKHLLVTGKTQSGVMNITAKNISSGISPVNPLGTYLVNVDLNGDKINVTTDSNENSVLTLNGSGTLSTLTLKASVNQEKAEKMKTFITLMGVPNADSTYDLKLF
jgi:general secretion pathway protein N